MDLQSACHWVEHEVPAHGDAGDHLAFLATLEVFLAEFDPSEAPRKKLWKKLSAPGTVSNFLDTVAEAGMALHLRRAGAAVQLEVPFDSEDPNSKDADIVVTIGDKRVWLDVISIEPEEELFVPDCPFPARSVPDIIDGFARSASAKYRKKFRDAVKAGQADCVGVLMCIIKSEELFIPFLPYMMTGEPMPPAPTSLWEKHPHLDIVWIHTLRKSPESALLFANKVITWQRPSPPFKGCVPMGTQHDQDLAIVALQAAYQGQKEIGLFYHLKVAETLVSLAARLSVSLHRTTDSFVSWAEELYGQMVGEVEADEAKGQDPRAGMPGIPAAGEKHELLITMKPDPDIWAKVSDALGPTTSAEMAERRAGTLLATAVKTWVLCRLDRESLMNTACHSHDEVKRLAAELSRPA